MIYLLMLSSPVLIKDNYRSWSVLIRRQPFRVCADDDTPDAQTSNPEPRIYCEYRPPTRGLLPALATAFGTVWPSM